VGFGQVPVGGRHIQGLRPPLFRGGRAAGLGRFRMQRNLVSMRVARRFAHAEGP
jgi:hypothetical protein